MNVINDMRVNGRYYIKQKMSNGQTLHLELSLYDENLETRQWNIALAVYSKRKHASHNENAKLMTGKNPFESVVTAIKAFKTLEETVRAAYPDINHIIFCTWVDNRRRDAYYKVLHHWGYDWGQIDGFKCIMKYFPKVEEAV